MNQTCCFGKITVWSVLLFFFNKIFQVLLKGETFENLMQLFTNIHFSIIVILQSFQFDFFKSKFIKLNQMFYLVYRNLCAYKTTILKEQTVKEGDLTSRAQPYPFHLYSLVMTKQVNQAEAMYSFRAKNPKQAAAHKLACLHLKTLLPLSPHPPHSPPLVYFSI